MKDTLGPATLSIVENLVSSRKFENALYIWDIFVSFVERLSTSWRILYPKFHCKHRANRFS